MKLLLGLMACVGDEAGVPEPKPAPPIDASEALLACATRVPELAITCRVEVAARAGREGSPVVVEQACGALDGRWAQECRFRSAEELAKAGMLAEGLTMCALSGEFSRFCVTHVGWGVTAAPGGPHEATEAVGWTTLAAVLPEALREEGAGILRARWWFLKFYGTGEADPRLVADLPEARGAWALEAVRLGGSRDAAAKAWTNAEVLRGEALPPERRVGRYDTMLLPAEKALPRVRTFGGGSRLMGENPEEDLEIALMEALYFQEQTTGDALVPWLEDPRRLVRLTAVRLFRILPSANAEERLRSLAADPDPIVQAHVADALQHKTWLGKGKGGGPAGP